jgi:hypothetical protein
MPPAASFLARYFADNAVQNTVIIMVPATPAALMMTPARPMAIATMPPAVSMTIAINKSAVTITVMAAIMAIRSIKIQIK